MFIKHDAAKQGSSSESVNAHRFSDLVADETFPCVGAKAALAHDNLVFFEAGSLESSESDQRLVDALAAFAARASDRNSFISFVVLFDDPAIRSEALFEQALWRRLQALHDLDCQKHDWDPAVSSDPSSPQFSFSIGGYGFYVVGLHPQASRPARRFHIPAIVFNLHNQFEQLREQGQYEKMCQVIRKRDTALAGSINPMLANFGETSEARQYSGRAVDADWKCPFHVKSDHAS